jgi:hypothetical protein
VRVLQRQLGNVREQVLRQQSRVLSEEAEDQPVQEAGDAEVLGFLEAPALALVFPAEKALLPHVGKAALGLLFGLGR